MLKKTTLALLSLAVLWSCGGKTEADLIVHNALVYTVDDGFSIASAFAVKDGKFVGV